MKKLFLIPCACLLTTYVVLAQLTPPQPAKKLIIKQQTGPGLESQPTRTEPYKPLLTSASYFLSSVKVTIGTGSDNKESLSNLSIELSVRNNNFQCYAQNNVTNELKTNTSTTIGLEKSNSYTSGDNPANLTTRYSNSATGSQNISLAAVESNGLSLRIIYKPNFFADAWKIETVSVTLEFRDANGNLHTTSGQKTFTFTNTSTFLDNFDKRILICTADNYFKPLTSFVTKDFSKRW